MTPNQLKHWHKVLSNGVEICHLLSTNTDKSVIAISIGCGHFDDPNDCQGLTHLLEHLLFMGNNNTPKPNGIIKAIEHLGASINAFTSSESMTIQCHCPLESMPKAIALIVDMLASPLLHLDAIEAEIETIDAEFQFKYQDDLRRLYDVHKSTCNSEHPFSQFSVGNRAVFSKFELDILQQMLANQHRKFFVGSNIKVCTIGNHLQTETKAFIEKSLLALRKGNNIVRSPLPALYLKDDLSIQIRVQPLIEAKRLILTFPLPGLSAQNRRSVGLISHIIGDENTGSILHLLKSKGWVSNLSAGGGIEGRNFKDFNINIQLTPTGELHINDIIHTVFVYIRLLNEPEPQPWRLKEKLQLERLFCNSEVIIPNSETAISIADGMHESPVDEIIATLVSPTAVLRSDVKLLLALFCTSNLRVKIISKNISVEQHSQWYSAGFTVEPLCAAQITTWLGSSNSNIDFTCLSLPAPNPYICGHAERRLKTIATPNPVRFWHKSNAEIWISGAPMFNQRLADCYISFECPENSKGANAMAAKRLWLGCLNDVIQSRYYAAEIAGLNYRLYGHQGGFSLHTSGFGIKQQHLISELIQHTIKHDDFSNSFEFNKQSLSNSLKNQLLNKPVNRLFTRLSVLMQRHSYASSGVLEELQSLSLKDMLSTRESMLDNYAIQGFMHGHWREDDANCLAVLFESIRHERATVTPIDRDVAKLTPQYTYFHEVESTQSESAALLFLQAPNSDPLNVALTMIFEQLLATPFFDELRTKKKLGYIVGSGFVAHNAHPGMVFYAQSPQLDANTIIQEITQFLISQLEHIDVYRRYWLKIQHNMLRQLLAPDISSTIRAQRLWMSLGLKDYEFSRNNAIAQHIQNFSFEDLVTHATALQNRLTFGELVLFTHGKFSLDETFSNRRNARKIDSVKQFKDNIAYTA